MSALSALRFQSPDEQRVSQRQAMNDETNKGEDIVNHKPKRRGRNRSRRGNPDRDVA